MIGLYFKSIAATSLIALCSLNSCKSTDSSDVKARVEEGSTGSNGKWTMVGERRDLYQAFGVTTCFAGNGIGVQQWKPGLNQNIATATLAGQLNGSLKTSTNLEDDIGDIFNQPAIRGCLNERTSSTRTAAAQAQDQLSEFNVYILTTSNSNVSNTFLALATKNINNPFVILVGRPSKGGTFSTMPVDTSPTSGAGHYNTQPVNPAPPSGAGKYHIN